MITGAIRSVHIPRRVEDRRVHLAAAVCQLDRVADMFGAHVLGPGVADRLTVEQVDRGGRSRGEPLRPLTAVTSHEQDKIFGVNVRGG